VSVSEGLVVQAAAARRQLDAEATARQATMQHVAERAPVVDATPDAHNGVVYSPPPSQTATATATQPRRFHGTVALDSSRMARDAGQIGEAVVQHLSSLLGARVTVNIEISADIPEGAPKSVVRAVTENCRALRFDSFGFEEL
jgi:hypothetical protein